MASHRPFVLSRTVIPVPPHAAPSLSCGCSHGCGNRIRCAGSCSLPRGELCQSQLWQSCSLWSNPCGRDELAHIGFHNFSVSGPSLNPSPWMLSQSAARAVGRQRGRKGQEGGELLPRALPTPHCKASFPSLSAIPCRGREETLVQYELHGGQVIIYCNHCFQVLWLLSVN